MIGHHDLQAGQCDRWYGKVPGLGRGRPEPANSCGGVPAELSLGGPVQQKEKRELTHIDLPHQQRGWIVRQSEPSRKLM